MIGLALNSFFQPTFLMFCQKDFEEQILDQNYFQFVTGSVCLSHVTNEACFEGYETSDLKASDVRGSSEIDPDSVTRWRPLDTF